MATLHLSPTDIWLPFPIAAWQDTYKTLHLWTQIVGKIRLALAPKINHWWHSTLYVTPRGLTTSTIPYGTGNFQITFNFILHQLLIETSDGTTRMIELAPRSVADFYQAVYFYKVYTKQPLRQHNGIVSHWNTIQWLRAKFLLTTIINTAVIALAIAILLNAPRLQLS